MATIVFNDGIDPIKGHRRGICFDISQAGYIAKRRPSPINHQTNHRMKVRALLKQANAFYWNLPAIERILWGFWATDNGIGGPPGTNHEQPGCAAFFYVCLNAMIAGDPPSRDPPGDIPHPGVTFTNLVRINKDTIRATFNPSPTTIWERIFLRQTLPGPGYRNWKKTDGYIAEISDVNVTSPYDFTTHFQHLAGWHCRYWTGTQETQGLRSVEDEWDL